MLAVYWKGLQHEFPKKFNPVLILDLSLTRYETVGKLFNFPRPQSPHTYIRDHNSNYLIRILQELNELIIVKPFYMCLRHKWSSIVSYDCCGTGTRQLSVITENLGSGVTGDLSLPPPTSVTVDKLSKFRLLVVTVPVLQDD